MVYLLPLSCGWLCISLELCYQYHYNLVSIHIPGYCVWSGFKMCMFNPLLRKYSILILYWVLSSFKMCGTSLSLVCTIHYYNEIQWSFFTECYRVSKCVVLVCHWYVQSTTNEIQYIHSLLSTKATCKPWSCTSSLIHVNYTVLYFSEFNCICATANCSCSQLT